MLAASPYCEINSPNCTRAAQGLQHMKGRGVNLLNRKFLKRACNACNTYCEEHPQWALDHGHAVSRLNK